MLRQNLQHVWTGFFLHRMSQPVWRRSRNKWLDCQTSSACLHQLPECLRPCSRFSPDSEPLCLRQKGDSQTDGHTAHLLWLICVCCHGNRPAVMAEGERRWWLLCFSRAKLWKPSGNVRRAAKTQTSHLTSGLVKVQVSIPFKSQILKWKH